MFDNPQRKDSTMAKLPRFIASRSVHALIFIVIAFTLYGFTLDYPFIFDSREFIKNNHLIRNTSTFYALFDLENFMDTHLSRVIHPEIVTSFASRPIAYLTFHLNYLLGGTNPSGYRLFNILVHICNALILYQMLRFIILRRVDRERPESITIPLFAALIFLVHPLQTQSVTYTVQRFASLGTFFYLATMLLYIWSSGEGTVSARRWRYACSLLTMILGMLTRENVITVPIVLVMTEIILLRRPWRGTLVRLAPHLVCMSLVPLMVLNIADELRDADLLQGAGTNIGGSEYGRTEYAITQLRVILSYFRMLVLPYHQNFDPDYPLFKSLFHPEIIVSIMIWTAFLVAGIRLLRRRERTICTDLTGFSIFWFPLALSVSSSFVPMTDLMFEHRTYLPSLAFCTGSVAYLHHATSRECSFLRPAMLGGLCLVAIILGGLTVQRNHVYSSRMTLWTDTVNKSPNKFRPNYALGYVLSNKAQDDQAIIYFKKAMSLDPSRVEAYISLGAVYLRSGMPNEVIRLYGEYLESYPPDTRLYTNLAMAYAQLNKLEEAIDIIDLVLTKRHYDPNLLSFMSELHLRVGHMGKAREFLAKARSQDEKDPTVNLAVTLNTLEGLIIERALETAAPTS